LKGVEVLKVGIVWIIGNVSNIDIWNDPWLPRETSRGQLRQEGRTLLSKISDLINPITGGAWWDEELVGTGGARWRPRWAMAPLAP
jgi:hypothetical protein